ncbi:MAG: HD domain-containing protein [Opitutales bacterium]|nr:HD domain-containing protein [Opitutales bacterium]
MNPIPERLERQVQFLIELDKLKSIYRQSYLSHEQRRENSGEHSWHVSIVALVLLEYADEKVDVLKVLKMLLIHDIVEIDAGDTYIYDPVGNEGKAEREIEAANRLFGMLPEEQAIEFRALWDEFEGKETAEAKFAGSCDRIIPLLHNYYAQGHSWKEHGIAKEQVYQINSVIEDGSASLWKFAKELIEESIKKGYLQAQ